MLSIPDVNKPWLFTISIILLFSGYFVDSKAWQNILQDELPTVTYTDAFISSGKYIFGKYIPGKVWIILGKAGYLNERYSFSLVSLGSLAIYYQIISLFAATLTGLAILYNVNITIFFNVLAFSTLLVVVFFFFRGWISEKGSKLLSLLLRSNIVLPVLELRMTFRVFALSLFMWIIWSFSFYVFLLSVYGETDLPVTAGMIFPVSSVLGIIVLIAPGGLGIREGFMVLALALFGIPAAQAASVALLSRIWSLGGEFLFFIAALFVSNRS